MDGESFVGAVLCAAPFSDNNDFFMKLTMNKINFLVLTGVMVCLVSGCSGSGIVTGYVEGVITLNGEPVPSATITFTPKADADGQAATGFSNENGVYKLTTQGGKDEGGAIPGEYFVAISKSDVPIIRLDQGSYDQQTVQSSAPGVTPRFDSKLPKYYGNPATSGLTATVNKGRNNIPFELTE